MQDWKQLVTIIVVPPHMTLILAKKNCRNKLLSLCCHVFYEFSNSLVRSQTSPKSYLAMLRAKAMTNIYLY